MITTQNQPPITIQQHILQEQTKVPHATGEFSFLLSAMTLACKQIQAKVRRAGLADILGSEGEENVQGEVQQKLDVYANDVMLRSLSTRKSVGVLASEENEQPIVVPHQSPDASYAVVFDPLDGSSNIDVNVSVGTTFSILRRPEGTGYSDADAWLLQPGSKQIAAGYVVYGSSTVMVYSVGNGVHGFTLDPNVGAFVLSHEAIKMPRQGHYYSVNEAYSDDFPAPYQKYLDRLRSGDLGHAYASRYIGSMVADFHRTLLRGGIFMYPPTRTHAQGKLRMLYEANPISFIAEHAGGAASNGAIRMLDVQPNSIHERTPLIVGSRVEMEEFQNCMHGGA